MAAAVAWGLFIVGSTEILSLFKVLDFPAVMILWSLACVGAGALLLYLCQRSKSWPILGVAIHPDIDRFQAAFLFFIAAATLTTALTAPPNTWDSMTYHMSRVWHWAQNKTVAHYPTGIERQLFLNPGAEMIILHFQILTGGDRLCNLPQWISMVGSAAGVSLIAKSLGASISAQFFSTVFVATMPMAILQSSSTQNDFVVTFWLVCFVYFGILMKKRPDAIRSYLTGASLGLAVLTKATAYIVGFPFVVWIGFDSIRSKRIRAIKYGCICALLFFAINGGHFARNAQLYGHPVAPRDYRGKNVNKKKGAGAIFSNVLRNCALHMEIPVQEVNLFLLKRMEDVHHLLGLDANDRDTTFGDTRFSVAFSVNEDCTGNPIHFALALCCFFLLFAKRRKKPRDLFAYSAAMLGVFLFFCFYIKWNPWNSRYQLPMFVLMAPVAANLLPGKKTVFAIACLMLFSSTLWLVYNYSRPLMSIHPKYRGYTFVSEVYAPSDSIFTTARWKQFFVYNEDMGRAYWHATDIMASMDCSRFGIVTGIDDWEYPFLALMGMKKKEKFSIRHYINGKSGKIEEDGPCAIFCTDVARFRKSLTLEDGYGLVWAMGHVGVFAARRGMTSGSTLLEHGPVGVQ